MHADKVNITKAYVLRESPAPTEFTPDEQKCLQSLFFTEMHWRKTEVANPAPATCAWLMQHPTYREWFDQGHGLLWIKGNPGTGKSTVLKHALETAEQSTKQTVILASFFFHGRGAPTQKSILGLFRSLLHQILQQNRDLLSKLTLLYKNKCQTHGSFADRWEWQANELQNFFKSNVVDAARTQQIRVYIDALDECGEDVAIDLVEFFRCFATPVSICFSCRHYPFVALEGGDEICVEDENEQDIKIYVQEKIEAHIHRTDIAETLQNEIVSRSQGNFQWVVLVIPRVLTLYKSRKSIATIQAMIQSIPTELHKLYAGLLSLAKDHEKAQSLRFMQWICFSFRPLTVRELRFALVMNPDVSHTSIHQCLSSEFYVDTDEDMELVVYDLSKGLAEVQQRGSKLVVQFIHQSVQDFLLEKGLQVLNSSIAGNVIGHGHLWISRSCIQYLSMEEIQDSATSLRSELGIDIAEMERNDYFGLFGYVLIYWLSHVEMLENANMSPDDLATFSTEASEVTLHEHFYSHLEFDIFHPSLRGSTTLLHITTDCNLINIMTAVLARTVRADQTDEYGQTSLCIAAGEGHALPLELLLGRDDVDVNHKNSRGDTPLSLAAEEGHEVVVKLLLNRDDVDVNHKNHYGDTPLSAIVRFNRHTAVVELLLQGNADPNIWDNIRRTPLTWAAFYGNYDVVKLLLQHNADTDVRDTADDTPLSLAASSGHCEVVRLLLQRTSNADSFDKYGRTPLSLAALKGHHEVVKLLLQRTINVDSVDNYGRTPLSLAALKGYYEVVKLLLQRTSNADSIDKSGRTPLSYTCGGGYKAIVKEFLKRSDVDINSRDVYDRSVLSWTIKSSSFFPISVEDHTYVVDMLLNQDDIHIDEAEKKALEKFQRRKRGKRVLNAEW